jgi:hypothetical protein
MSQSSFNIPDSVGSAFLANVNAAVQAAATLSSGATAPTPTTYAYQFWYDTTANTLKIRNASNTSWVTLGDWASGTSSFAAFVPSGSSVPTNGMYLPGTNILGWATNSTQRATIDASGNFLIGGTGTATARLTVNGSGQSPNALDLAAVAHMTAADSAVASTTIDSFGNFTAFIGRRANGTNASKSALVANDIITSIGAMGYGTSAYSSSGSKAFLNFLAAENWTNTAQGTFAEIWVTPTGSTSPSRAIRIDSSNNLLCGLAASNGTFVANYGGAIYGSGSSVPSLALNRNTSDGSVAIFARAATGVGSISVTASATAYNTSSDYRLKENLEPATGCLDRILGIPVYRGNFKATPGVTQTLILAHELKAKIPTAVVGSKDEVDVQGNPVIQQADFSAAVTDIIGAIHELAARLDALESP